MEDQDMQEIVGLLKDMRRELVRIADYLDPARSIGSFSIGDFYDAIHKAGQVGLQEVGQEGGDEHEHS